MAFISARLGHIINKLNAVSQSQVLKQSLRPSSYRSSLFLEDVGQVNRKYEVTSDPDEWKSVERVLPPQIVPEPLKKENYPSGWKPQADNLQDSPYFIKRTKNHMIPVYLKVRGRGNRRHTILRNVQGDIWLLEKEMKEFLQPQSARPLRIQVDEFTGRIRMNGDFVNAIKYWLEQRQF